MGSRSSRVRDRRRTAGKGRLSEGAKATGFRRGKKTPNNLETHSMGEPKLTGKSSEAATAYLLAGYPRSSTSVAAEETCKHP